MNLTIVGLDVFGTSVGLALKAATTAIPITGHDPDTDRVARAKKLGAIDRSHWNLISACDQADLIVLDVPLDTLEKTLRALGSELKQRTVIVDTAPAKRLALAWAEAALPEHIQYVGWHPVARGLQASRGEPSAAAFQGATVYLTAAEKVAAWALEAVSNLVAALGARPHFTDAAEHDGLAAATMHLPLLNAVALIRTIQDSAGRQECIRLVGGELAAQAELLINRPSAAAELLANGDNVVRWIEAYMQALSALHQLIATQDREALTALCSEATQLWAKWMTQDCTPPSGMERVDGMSDWKTFFLGNLGRRSPR